VELGADPREAGRRVVDRLTELPGGRALGRAAARVDGVHLVGGAVRDLLLGGRPRELDVVVDGDPDELIARLGATQPPVEVVRHGRFGTASVLLEAGGGRVDIARSRRERYPRPGALPEVEPAPLEEDLLRRDFTVNAIAVSLPGGELAAAPGALEDLTSGRLRVLHDESFLDDPTRLLRLARLRVRLGFAVEPHTARLASRSDLDSVSLARIGAEVRLALAEPDPIGALAAYAELPGLPLEVDRDLIGRALRLLGDGGRPDLLTLAAATRRPADAAWLGGLELTGVERDVLLACWDAGPLASAIAATAGTPSLLGAALARQPAEAVALAGALGPAGAAASWLGELRHVELEIDGGDLIAAGIAAGPDLGRRLERTLARKLDGDLPAGREAELASALADSEQPAGSAADGLARPDRVPPAAALRRGLDRRRARRIG
jgi:tRNA nucleotidyltransferase (CCA-adding enzyme)